MSFLWVRMLWLMALVPALVAAYILVQRRRQKYALRYASLSLMKEALGAGPGLRRHVPPILFIAALATLVFALARPETTMLMPSQYGTVILALDNSGSMRADDVKPSRMEAAQAAARGFVDRQPAGSRIGVVSFAGSASLVQPPTRDREAVIAAIGRLTLQRGTAVGSGIRTALEAILEDFGEEPLPAARGAPPAAFPGFEAETFAPAIIVLLSDGQSNTGPDPLEMAALAADRRVRVYTVGLGSPEGTILSFFNRSVRVRLDEETLKRVAERTGGAYFKADSESNLREIYEELGSRLVFRPEKTEITAVFAALAVVLLLLAGVFSLLWFNRLP